MCFVAPVIPWRVSASRTGTLQHCSLPLHRMLDFIMLVSDGQPTYKHGHVHNLFKTVCCPIFSVHPQSKNGHFAIDTMNEPTDNELDKMTHEELIAEVKRLRGASAIEPDKPMEYVKIIAFLMLAACVYGIAHNLITAHVCVEYFLPPIHPIIFPTESPIALALVWRVIATWWVGFLLGIPLAAVCRLGRKPKLTVKDIILPVLVLHAILYVSAMLFGIVGYAMASVLPIPFFPCEIAPERHAAFLFNFAAHNFSYHLGAVGGIVLMFCLWKQRGKG